LPNLNRRQIRSANPAVSRIAGARWFSPFGLLVHRGRRTGRRYVTPVGMGWTGGAFVIPLTFGERSHWYKNVIEAGECAVRWKGADHRVGRPEVVAVQGARGAFPLVLWLLLRAVGIRHWLKLSPLV